MFLLRRILATSDPYQALVSELAAERPVYYAGRKGDSQISQQVFAMEPSEQRAFLFAALRWLNAKAQTEDFYAYWPVRQVVLALLRRKLPFEHDDLVLLLDWSIRYPRFLWHGQPAVVNAVEMFLSNKPLTPLLSKKMLELAWLVESSYCTAELRKVVARLRVLAGDRTQRLPMVPGDVWADQAKADINALGEAQKTAWRELLNLCLQATGGSPRAKWLASVQPLFDQIGFEAYKQAVTAWLALLDKPRTRLPDTPWSANAQAMDDTNADLLRGLIWLCARHEDVQLARALAAAAVSAYRSVPGIGPRCVRVGNACVWALGAMPGTEGLAQLAVLKSKIKYGSAQKSIEHALAAAAKRIGLPAADLQELSVPAYGLQEVGRRRLEVGGYTVELVITSDSSVETRWSSPTGKRRATLPKAVKTEHPLVVKDLANAAKDIRTMLVAQRNRIENLYLENKSWSLASWRERYLEHPLVGTLARRLIWHFRNGDDVATGIWYRGQIVGRNGSPLALLNDATQVELWHPLHATTDAVLAWRSWLAEREIQQPFKQAYREIYLLTDAERTTQTYSNRFAAHIIKQHQFNALCAARGWKNSLRLMVDNYYPPATRLLPAWDLRAEFWVEGIGDNYGTDTNGTGTYLHLTTDQVRFYRQESRQNTAHAGGGGYASYAPQEADEPVPLEQIPPLVFSEIMRDADLFVGVASVGNDPNWMDGGNNGRHREYWTSYSFGTLSETAKTRKHVLELLLPRLKIAERCRLADKFLVVRGDLRTYKIHLGSGNILMEPNDQYLCIVPSRGTAGSGVAGKLFLPFEGDAMLSIILSKALLLAGDKQITDPTIVRQIQL